MVDMDLQAALKSLSRKHGGVDTWRKLEITIFG